MLGENQIKDVWEGKISAEVRSLYFGDLAGVYALRKQWITGISFFLWSGAAATLIGKAPIWVPAVLSIIVSVITAYAVAVNLDAKTRTMAKLHYAWGQIGNDYSRLWSHTYSTRQRRSCLIFNVESWSRLSWRRLRHRMIPSA